MPGAEAIAVLGAISSIITIVDATKKIYDAATDVTGLPEAFREVAGRLPIVLNILDSAKQSLDKGDVHIASREDVMPIIGACKKKAMQLDKLFQKAIPSDGASDLEQYYKAVKAYGRGNEVEKLMKEILEDLQLLACERGMETATKAQQEEIAKAITEVSAIPPSVPEHMFQEKTGFTANNSGAGAQTNHITQGEYITRSEYIAQGEARQYNSGGGPMTIGLERNEYEACLAALFLTDPNDDRDNLIQKKGRRVDGTCLWIKDNKLYRSWLESHLQLLWISGGPGKGKTMLSIFLGEELKRTAEHSGALVLQYFCDNNDEKRNTAVAIIRGLIFQLLQLRPKLADYILPTFKTRGASLFESSSLPSLWTIFEKMTCASGIGTTYCVLDGLDECDAVSSEALLKNFRDLFSKESSSSGCQLKLVIVSRDFPDFIPHVLSSFPHRRLDLEAKSHINNDIRQFIEVRVNELSASREYTEQLRDDVKEIFQRRAQGTFLWVGIVAKELEKYCATEVRKGLELFPRGLDKLYARMLHQIDVNRREISAKILLWVVLAIRPLTVTELSVAAGIEPSADFTRDEVMKDIISYSRHFLTIEGNKIGLAHQSVKDYLLRKRHNFHGGLEIFHIDEKRGNFEVAQKCLGYLQSGALAGGAIDLKDKHSPEATSRLKAFPLLSYAVLYWGEHARLGTSSGDNFDLQDVFYGTTSRIRESWLKTYWSSKFSKRPLSSFGPMHVASYFGIVPLAERLLCKQKWINRADPFNSLKMKDSLGRTPFLWAVRGGHEEVVHLLLERGGDDIIKPKCERGASAIHHAVDGGSVTMIQLLLEKGVDVQAKDKYGRAALHYAVRDENKTAIQLLLNEGADINAKDKIGWTSLHLAVRDENKTAIQLLLNEGADINAKDKIGWTSLHCAVRDENKTAIQLLLNEGADINAKERNGCTPLHLAARWGKEAAVHLLLDNGADINISARNSDEKKELCRASEKGREELVKVILDLWDLRFLRRNSRVAASN